MPWPQWADGGAKNLHLLFLPEEAFLRAGQASKASPKAQPGALLKPCAGEKAYGLALFRSDDSFAVHIGTAEDVGRSLQLWKQPALPSVQPPSWGGCGESAARAQIHGQPRQAEAATSLSKKADRRRRGCLGHGLAPCFCWRRAAPPAEPVPGRGFSAPAARYFLRSRT